ncbi:hypothetical protein [Chitinophaga filiformis]|uniref:Uncharacterized protein n=1 Tax=Chitinophaga filiformis TaxID=104663 RepID=A0ABY4HY91_CHIFI|nr:hypothetical protein [Chitinophaga filiformis]UPK67979.1 hypothetical protein MYF79_23790 [Chitinophaga filiformis]
MIRKVASSRGWIKKILRKLQWNSFGWFARLNYKKYKQDQDFLLQYINSMATAAKCQGASFKIPKKKRKQLLTLFRHVLFKNLTDVVTFLGTMDITADSIAATSVVAQNALLDNAAGNAEGTLEYYRQNHYRLIGLTYQLIQQDQIYISRYRKKDKLKNNAVDIMQLFDSEVEPWWSFFPMLEIEVTRNLHPDVPPLAIVATENLQLIFRNLGMTSFCLAKIQSIVSLSCFMEDDYINIEINIPLRGDVEFEQLMALNFITESWRTIDMAATKARWNFDIQKSRQCICYVIQLPQYGLYE